MSFVREQFPPAAGVGADFGAVYSISVLEHVPMEAIDAVMAGAREILGERGCQIHAVDHVLAGWGADEHLAKLRRIAAGMGVSDAELDAAIAALRDDPETYFVSAEAHNRWRGALPYDEYAMRRIVSVNLFAGTCRAARRCGAPRARRPGRRRRRRRRRSRRPGSCGVQPPAAETALGALGSMIQTRACSKIRVRGLIIRTSRSRPGSTISSG